MKAHYIVIFIFITNILIGQNDYSGLSVTADTTTFETRDIVSDFGPRMICYHDFHGGIDYTSHTTEDRGWHIKAIEAGTIYRVGGAIGTKYMVTK